jgi:hypothetical protein
MPLSLPISERVAVLIVTFLTVYKTIFILGADNEEYAIIINAD